MPANILDLFSLEHLQAYVADRRFGRTHYLEGFVPESYLDLVWHTPVRLLFFMFTPFPWMIDTIGDLLVMLDVLVYITLLYYSFKGLKKIFKFRKIETICLVFIVFSIATMYSWGTVNYGTAWRHRAKLAPFLILMASVGLTNSSKCNFTFPHDDPIKIDGYGPSSVSGN